jgi:hypothetical protein
MLNGLDPIDIDKLLKAVSAAVTTDVEVRGFAFGQVAVACAIVGDLAGALDAIHKIEVLDRRFGEVLIRVAKLAAAIDEEPTVRAIVDHWPPDGFQDPPQWLIAQSVTLAELVGDVERAEAASALITSVVSRCAALAFRARGRRSDCGGLRPLGRGSRSVGAGRGSRHGATPCRARTDRGTGPPGERPGAARDDRPRGPSFR